MKKFKFVTRIESTYDIEADDEGDALKKACKLHEGIVVGYKTEGELPPFVVEVPSFSMSTPERVITIEDLNAYAREHAVDSDGPEAAFDVVCRLDNVSFKDRNHAEEFCSMYSRWVENFQPHIITRDKKNEHVQKSVRIGQ